MSPTLEEVVEDVIMFGGIMYGKGTAQALGILMTADQAGVFLGVTGHPRLVGRHGPAPLLKTLISERMLRDREMICRWGGRVESLGP